MVNEKNGVYTVGKLELNSKTRKLRIGDVFKHVQPKKYKCLLLLIKNWHRVVETEELYAEVWKKVIVNDENLNRVISELRAILGGHDAIINIPRVGYQFNPSFFIDVNNIPCPWMGFRQYTKDHEEYFCGRGADIYRILNKLKAGISLFSLIGPSGVGKSSIISAGIIPKLKRGEIHGSNTWTYLSIRPTHNPLWELSKKIASLKYTETNVSGDAVEQILDNLRENPNSIIQELSFLEDSKLFLFIDQVEELLSKDSNKVEAALFVQSILEVIKNADIMQSCILNLRRSFYPQFLATFTELGSLLTENTVHINEMTIAQLKEVIDEPADRVGLKLDEGLSEEIVKDINARAGILPLLSNFLVELFHFRDGEKITHKHYQLSGGIENSISKYADRVFESLSEEQKPLAEKLLILLSDTGERPELDSCKQVEETRILEKFPNKTDEIRHIIQTLHDKRLLVHWTDSMRDKSFVELPHAALIKNWSKMQNLLADKRRAIRFAESLERKTDLWLQSDKNSNDLLKGTQLQTAIELYEEYETYLGQNEKDFYFVSKSAKEKEDERNQREQRKKRFYTYASMMMLLVLFSFVSIALNYFREKSKYEAAKTTTDAAKTILDQDPAKALKLAIQGMEGAETEEAIAVLRAAIAGSHLKAIYKGHGDALKALAISNNGKLLVTSSRDQTSLIWNAETDQLLHKLEGHGGPVESASFSPDNRFVATSGGDQTVRLWDVTNGKEIKKLKLQTGINNVVFSSDGRFILTAGGDGTSAVWEYGSSSVPAFQLNHHQNGDSTVKPLNSAVFNPDGKLIATGSGDMSAIIWDASSRKPIKTLKHSDSVLNLAFSPDGNVLVTAGRDNIVKIWSTKDWSLQQELRHQGAVNCIAFNSTGDLLVTAGMEMKAFVWDWRKGTNILTLRGHTGPLTSVMFSPDNRFIYTSSADSEARAWEIIEDFGIKNIGDHKETVYESSFSPDGQLILTASQDKSACVWNAQSGELLKRFTHTAPVKTAKFSPDAKTVATATDEGKILLWEIKTGVKLREYPAHLGSIHSVAFNSTGQFIASGDQYGAVKLWDVASGKELKTYVDANGRNAQGRITNLVFSPEDRILAASSDDRTVRFWDTTSHKPLPSWNIGTGAINGIAFSPDGKYVLASCFDKSLRIWDRINHKLVNMLLGHAQAVNQAKYSPNGEFIISGSGDNTARIWSSLLQRELFKIMNSNVLTGGNASKEDDSILAVSFNSNGSDLVYSCKSGLVKIFRCAICTANAKDLLDVAKSRLPREVSP